VCTTALFANNPADYHTRFEIDGAVRSVRSANSGESWTLYPDTASFLLTQRVTDFRQARVWLV